MGIFDSRFWQVAAGGTVFVFSLAAGVFDGGATAALTLPHILSALTVSEVGGALGVGSVAAAGVRKMQASKPR